MLTQQRYFPTRRATIIFSLLSLSPVFLFLLLYSLSLSLNFPASTGQRHGASKLKEWEKIKVAEVGRSVLGKICGLQIARRGRGEMKAEKAVVVRRREDYIQPTGLVAIHPGAGGSKEAKRLEKSRGWDSLMSGSGPFPIRLAIGKDGELRSTGLPAALVPAR